MVGRPGEHGVGNGEPGMGRERVTEREGKVERGEEKKVRARVYRDDGRIGGGIGKKL